MVGKKKCRLLREIRQQIAAENEIPFATEDCRYQGDCRGTCPKCESELRYLETQLEKRRSIGKKVTVSALAVGVLATAAACRGPQIAGAPVELEGDVPYTEELDGEVAETACDIETGTAAAEAESTEEASTVTRELAGSIAYAPEETADG